MHPLSRLMLAAVCVVAVRYIAGCGGEATRSAAEPKACSEIQSDHWERRPLGTECDLPDVCLAYLACDGDAYPPAGVDCRLAQVAYRADRIERFYVCAWR